VAGRLRVSAVRECRRLADGKGQVDVHRVRAADVGDGRDDLSPDPDAALDMVRGDLVPHLAEERDVGAGVAAGTGCRLLRDGVGWLQKLRRAMVRPERELLSGVVELDEVFIGNESRGPAGGVKDNCAAMIAVESIPGRKLGRVRIEVAEPPRSVSMLSFADRVIAKGSIVRTDGANYLRKLSAAGYQHVAFVGIDSPEPAHVNLPGVHMVASLLKRWLTGTLHYAVSQEHLGYYLDEYTFRFNRRTSKSRGLLFYRLLQQTVNTDPHPLDELRNPVVAVKVPFQT
jgi:transposase-like protein